MLLSSSDKIKQVLDVAKGFLQNDLPELAMLLLASAMKERMTFKTLVQRQTLTASVLMALAKKRDARWEDRLELLQAANEACQIAERYVDKSMEVPKLVAASSNTKKVLDSLLKEKPIMIFFKQYQSFGASEIIGYYHFSYIKYSMT